MGRKQRQQYQKIRTALVMQKSEPLNKNGSLDQQNIQQNI